MRRGHYHVLGVDLEANNNDIEKNYRKISRYLHPDRNNAPQANQAYIALNLAKTILLNPAYKFQNLAFGTYNPEHEEGEPPAPYPQPSREPPEIYQLPNGGYRFDYDGNDPSPTHPSDYSIDSAANEVNYY